MIINNTQGVTMTMFTDLEARVQHKEERLPCAVEGLARPQWVGEKAAKHLQECG